MIDYMTEKLLEGAIMMVDFTKAFDVIDILFIKTCLEKLNFGEDFKHWVSVLYKQTVSSVIVNGSITEQFETQRGIRQGCPLSALLFVIAAEFLANKIRKNNHIKGVCFSNNNSRFELKLLQYADDTTFFVADKDSLEVILKELDMFGKVAGPKINKEKTAMLWVGKKENRWNLSDMELTWEEDVIRYLGFYITGSSPIACKANWENKLDKMQRLLDNWRKRNLTIFGRVTVLKTLALSQIIHLLMFHTVPNVIMKKINKMFYRFLWQGQTDKVRRCDVIKNCLNGGVKMVDVEKLVFSFRLRWIGRLVDDTEAVWKHLAHYWFDRFGGINLILNSDFQAHNVSSIFGKNMPEFYVEIVHAWSQIDKKIFGKELPVEKNILWHNQNITFNKNTLYYKEWFESGIIRLEDILLGKSFKTVEEIRSVLKTKNIKRCVIFHYSKLRQAIPKIWLTQISETNRDHNTLPVAVPHIETQKGVKRLCDVTSRYFYNQLIKMEGIHTRCCLYWENKIGINIAWENCFARNLVKVKENKLKEFNFKVLYNLLPVKRNLCKWKISDDSQCNVCHVDEDIIHALITCRMNRSFWKYIYWVCQKVFHISIDINVSLLLKINEKEDIDDFMNIAFWCIYKLIILRNHKGKDDREHRLKYLFVSELRRRLEVNQLCSGRPLFNLPNDLFAFV